MNIFQNKEAQTVEVAGRSLSCPVCSNKRFWTRRAQLNKSVSSFFNLDWTDRSATCFVCSECTYIYWFLGS